MRYRNPRPVLRRAIAPAAIAALIPALMLTGGTATAAGPFAHRPASVPRVISANLNVVSCKGNSFCMAAGSYRTQRQKGLKLTEAWNGRRWHDVPDPLSGHLITISCGGPAFCFAARGGVSRFARLGAVWNGRTWKAFKNAFDAAGATCGSPKLCMNTNVGATEIDVWNGKRWRSDPSTNACTGNPPGDPCGYNDLSCGSASTCMAMSFACTTQDCPDGPEEFSAVWNGTSWLSAPSPAAGSLSCSWGGFCMLISWSAQVEGLTANIWDSAGWQDVSPDLPAICTSAQKCGLNGALSCGAPQACVLIPKGSPVTLIWSHLAWKAVPLATIRGTAPNLSGLSCGSGTNCMAVGSHGKPGQPVAEHWNGTRWQLTKPLNH